MKRIDTRHFDTAQDYWNGLDKESLGEDDIPELVRMLNYLFLLCEEKYHGTSTVVVTS